MEALRKRRKTRQIEIGSIKIGAEAPIVVQSMTNTNTRNVTATVAQINSLAEAGCELVRVAVPDMEAAQAIAFIKKGIKIPLIADIHFDHRLALAALESGADGIRINPGNISKADLKTVLAAARVKGAAIRIGVNAGSLEKDLWDKHRHSSAAALVESALRAVSFLEDNGFENFKLSLKSSDVATTIAAYRLISHKTNYPLHLGVTEAGSLMNAAIKSAIGIGTLLCDGIGDTLRVSVTGNPLAELPIAYGILSALNIRRLGVNIISCPTCGRCEINLPLLVQEVEERLQGVKADITVALMGCVVNGIGEAKDADIGIAGGKGAGMLFKKGKAIKKVAEADFVGTLMEHLTEMLGGKFSNGRRL